MTPEQIKIFQSMSPAEKLDLAARFHLEARRLKAAGLRTLHPEWSEARIQRRVRELFLYAAD